MRLRQSAPSARAGTEQRSVGHPALPQSGFVRQEQVSLRDFLANRFGQLYEGQSLDAMATV